MFLILSYPTQLRIDDREGDIAWLLTGNRVSDEVASVRRLSSCNRSISRPF